MHASEQDEVTAHLVAFSFQSDLSTSLIDGYDAAMHCMNELILLYTYL